MINFNFENCFWFNVVEWGRPSGPIGGWHRTCLTCPRNACKEILLKNSRWCRWLKKDSGGMWRWKLPSPRLLRGIGGFPLSWRPGETISNVLADQLNCNPEHCLCNFQNVKIVKMVQIVTFASHPFWFIILLIFRPPWNDDICKLLGWHTELLKGRLHIVDVLVKNLGFMLVKSGTKRKNEKTWSRSRPSSSTSLRTLLESRLSASVSMNSFMLNMLLI